MRTGSLYAGAAEAWAAGAELVYRPLAAALVATSPVELGGRVVLDVGAGTGAGSAALRAVGARPVAADLVFDMVRHDAAIRPPAMVADIVALAVGTSSVDAALAPFVLNHLDRPEAAIAELVRCVGPGGAVLASTFAESDRPPVKDQIDAVAAHHGWTPPDEYTWLRTAAIPRCGTVERFAAVARRGGLADVHVVEVEVDVGVSAAADLVAYRLGMAHVSGFLAGLAPDERAALEAEAVAEVQRVHDGSPLAPRVLLLAGLVPSS